jgi:hypothetical protein
MSWENDPFKDARSMNEASMTPGMGGNLDVFGAADLTDPKNMKANVAKATARPTPVALPAHLFIPEGAQSLDLRKLATVTTATLKGEFFRFKSPPGVVTRFLSYGVYNDGALASAFKFEPEVNGNRVFPYHGDPSDNFRIALGLAPDLSNNSLIPCQLALMPEQEIIWYVTNTSGVDTDMGVRMVGYFDTTQRLTTPRFGG